MIGEDNKTIYSFTVNDIKGREVAMKQFRNKTLLIVNVASKCGFTPQYQGLEQLYQQFKAQGFLVLGFPCNQFGGQEPGSEQEIQQFCELNYAVTFPLFAKLDVNGKNAHPLYQFLKHSVKGILRTEAIKWNFTKFLVDKNGKVLERFAPTATPESLVDKIAAVL